MANGGNLEAILLNRGVYMKKLVLASAIILSQIGTVFGGTLDLSVTRVSKAKCPGAAWQIFLPNLQESNGEPVATPKNFKGNLIKSPITINSKADLKKDLKLSLYMSFFKCLRGEKTFTKREMISRLDNLALSRFRGSMAMYGEFDSTQSYNLEEKRKDGSALYSFEDIQMMTAQILKSAKMHNLVTPVVTRSSRSAMVGFINKSLDYEKVRGDSDVNTAYGEVEFSLDDFMSRKDLEAFEAGRDFAMKLTLSVSMSAPYNVFLIYNAKNGQLSLQY